MNEKRESGFVSGFVTTLCAVTAIASTAMAVSFYLKLSKLEGAKKPLMAGAKQGPLAVQGVKAVSKPLVPSRAFIGRTEAIESVDIVSRVQGIIEKVYVKSGDSVKKGDLLFHIEEAEFVAQVNLKEALLAQAKADLSQSEQYLKRLQSADLRSISQSDLETATSTVLGQQAKVKQADADLALARLNLSYCKIYAPIAGKLGKIEHTEGNLVNTSVGTLVKLVQTAPIRVVFSNTDKEFIDTRSASLSGMFEGMKLNVELANGKLFNEDGELSYIDNMMDENTGTIAIRADFKNVGEILIPGNYVKILASPLSVKNMPVIPQSALLNDKDGAYIFVVDVENKVETRRVETGLNVDGAVTILNGLAADEVVVTQGLQKVRSGMEVVVNLVEPVVGGKK
ncbi:MAG: efflux RND transporter periplasmic adaptor subunit [Lentisphaeria bacterium]